jgi:F0F1-type ATP synthase membrane subunit a
MVILDSQTSGRSGLVTLSLLTILLMTSTYTFRRRGARAHLAEWGPHCLLERAVPFVVVSYLRQLSRARLPYSRGPEFRI